ncbi:MAG: VIT1/CCC1 transporter family protein [Actinomycetota bacterium]|nr:VIT1/CCC1 transporter family protein [Actinomycetota bacterium]
MSAAGLQIEHAHRDVTGGWLRPAVFGAMDGLVSNFALIAGVAGGTAGRGSEAVVLAGLAGLAAGAFSMAAGEYTSVASQSELAAAEIEIERRELLRAPQAEQEELAQMYVGRGVDVETAREVARQLSRDPDRALEVHTREELGIDPDDLPSPVVAAGSSFASFAVGAFLPLVPYLLGATTLWPALIVALLGLFACGALVSRVTARSWLFSGLRQLVLGGAAAALTYGFGSLVGAGLA